MRTKRSRLPSPDQGFSRDPGSVRVLLECSDPSIAWAGERILRDADYDVAVCWGPGAQGCTAEACPLISGDGCPLAEAADIIVQSFGVAERDSFPILQAMRERLPHKPLLVEVPRPSRQKYGDYLRGCTVIDRPATRDRLVDAVDGVWSRAERRPMRGSQV